MKQIISAIVVFSSIFIASNVYAMNIETFLYANNSTVDARIAYLDKMDYGSMVAGVEGTYKSDDYKIMSIDAAVKSDDFLPGSRYKIGFKGVYADAEKNDNFDSQLASVCFLFGIEHDLSDKINPLNIPVSFGGEISGSPEPLTWDDGETFFDVRANMNFHVMGNAAVIVEYRYLRADFEKDGYDWDEEDHNLLFGYKIKF
ncbi:MAG: hypothetical protein ACQEQS_04355 [Thermodesulfobacteriota bacterium]